MIGGKCSQYARCAGWWIERNPTYLLSAGLIAAGARLYLVEPETRPGEVGLILLTLGVLQAYEWAVTGILLLLHRWRRSPEDEPSLLLVSALFWTGPMAATTEMAARRPHLGFILAAGVCVIALAEFRAVRRLIGLRISVMGRLAGCACVVLLACALPLVRVPEEAGGTNELFLYCAWWLLAGIALMGIGAVRTHVPSRPTSAWPARTWSHLWVEVIFLLIVLAATVAHLVGMNYAFYGHAEWFYVSPLLVAVAVVVTDFLARMPRPGRWLLAAVSLLPAVAILLAFTPFDPNVPTRMLPLWLRDPMLVILLAATIAWWFGYRRHHWPILLHAGSAALAGALYRAVSLPRFETSQVVHSLHAACEPSRDFVVIALYAVAGYLLIVAGLRRTRYEALAAIFVNQAAVTLHVWERIGADVMIICLVAGWSWLIALHLAVRQPRLSVAIWPIVFLVAATWLHDFEESLHWYARVHAAGVVVVLLIAGQAFKWTRYRSAGGGVGVAHVVFYAIRGITGTQSPAASLIVIGGFVLLMIGASISWHKATLLEVMRRPEPTESPG